MKRNLEDETVNLIGRSAAERSLDRFYNRQRKELDKLKTKDDEQGDFLKFKKVLPFPEPVISDKETKTESDSEPKVKTEPVKKTLKEILNDLNKKHIPNRNKFAKSVNLLAKLSNSYFRESYRTENDVTYVDFFSVFVTVNDVFVKEFSGSVPKDCLDEKSSLVSLTKVLDYLLESNSRNSNVKEEDTQLSPYRTKKEENENKERTKDENKNNGNVKKEESDSQNSELVFSSNEKLFLNYLKLSFGYSASLWYENDPFAFHGIVNTLKRFFEDFLENTKFGFVLSDINKVNNDPFELPTRDQLLSLQLKSFVRTLGVVFSFFDYPWSKSSLVPLFSLVYLKRNVFEESDQTRISSWQSHINSNKSKGVKSVVVQGIGESSFEVQDGREERITSVHGSQVWSDRQLRL